MLIIIIKCSDIKTAQHDQAYKLECIHQDEYTLLKIHSEAESLRGLRILFFNL